jgi:transaldolase
MKRTQHLYDLGQRLWLDNITRVLLNSQTYKLSIDDLAVTFPATATRIGWQEE